MPCGLLLSFHFRRSFGFRLFEFGSSFGFLRLYFKFSLLFRGKAFLSVLFAFVFEELAAFDSLFFLCKTEFSQTALFFFSRRRFRFFCLEFRFFRLLFLLFRFGLLFLLRFRRGVLCFSLFFPYLFVGFPGLFFLFARYGLFLCNVRLFHARLTFRRRSGFGCERRVFYFFDRAVFFKVIFSFFHNYPSLKRKHVRSDRHHGFPREYPFARRDCRVVIIKASVRRIPPVHRVLSGGNRRAVRRHIYLPVAHAGERVRLIDNRRNSVRERRTLNPV